MVDPYHIQNSVHMIHCNMCIFSETISNISLILDYYKPSDRILIRNTMFAIYIMPWISEYYNIVPILSFVFMPYTLNISIFLFSPFYSYKCSFYISHKITIQSDFYFLVLFILCTLYIEFIFFLKKKHLRSEYVYIAYIHFQGLIFSSSHHFKTICWFEHVLYIPYISHLCLIHLWFFIQSLSFFFLTNHMSSFFSCSFFFLNLHRYPHTSSSVVACVEVRHISW